MAEKVEEKRIREALELLNEVAKEKEAELQKMVSDKYGNLKSAFSGVAEDLQDRAKEAFAQGEKKVKDFASRVDERVRQNPWPYLGGTALGFLILGLFFGRPRK